MRFFGKKIILPDVQIPSFEDDTAELEKKIQKEVKIAEQRLDNIGAENHKKKGLQAMPHVIEQLINGLKKDGL